MEVILNFLLTSVEPNRKKEGKCDSSLSLETAIPPACSYPPRMGDPRHQRHITGFIN